MKVSVLIKPNSKHREEVVTSDDGSLLVFTKEPAIEGRANKAAIKLIANHYRVSKSRVTLKQGHASKYKVFEVEL